MIGNLTLRTLISPYGDDVTRNSVLSFADLDNNLLFLKGNIIGNKSVCNLLILV